jgi:hypothetical protein
MNVPASDVVGILGFSAPSTRAPAVQAPNLGIGGSLFAATVEARVVLMILNNLEVRVIASQSPAGAFYFNRIHDSTRGFILMPRSDKANNFFSTGSAGGSFL